MFKERAIIKSYKHCSYNNQCKVLQSVMSNQIESDLLKQQKTILYILAGVA